LGGYGGVGASRKTPDFKTAGFGGERDNYMDEHAYLSAVPKLFEAVRIACGEEVELLHDIHERNQPMDVINLCRKLEQYRPFFIELITYCIYANVYSCNAHSSKNTKSVLYIADRIG
jgi:mannonate dehydratase